MAKSLEKVITHLKKTFRSAKKRAIKKLYALIEPSYKKHFSGLAAFPELQKLDRRLNYFILQASFGDKWFIISLLPAHLEKYPTSRVIAGAKDRELVELFVGETCLSERFVFIDEAALNRLSSKFRPISPISSQIMDSWSAPGCFHAITPYLLKNGLPPGTIRHLHLCYYPYFNELFNVHAVGYLTLVKTLLYLPFSAKPRLPTFYRKEDHEELDRITESSSVPSKTKKRPFILFNAVNISHQSLALSQISLISALFESAGYRVIINSAQSKQRAEFIGLTCNRENLSVADIPPRIVALVCNAAYAAIGVLGGAMSIAVQFSSTHILSFQSKSLGTGVEDEDLYADRGKGNLWLWADQDWPCLHPGRVMANEYIGDPKSLSDESLRKLVESFIVKIRSKAS
jgi:hypothetical protein